MRLVLQGTLNFDFSPMRSAVNVKGAECVDHLQRQRRLISGPRRFRKPPGWVSGGGGASATGSALATSADDAGDAAGSGASAVATAL